MRFVWQGVSLFGKHCSYQARQRTKHLSNYRELMSVNHQKGRFYSIPSQAVSPHRERQLCHMILAAILPIWRFLRTKQGTFDGTEGNLQKFKAGLVSSTRNLGQIVSRSWIPSTLVLAMICLLIRWRLTKPHIWLRICTDAPSHAQAVRVILFTKVFWISLGWGTFLCITILLIT